MADADNLAYLAGELRKHAKKFSDAATTLNTQATQLNWSTEDLASSASSWAGSGSQAFQSAWQNYHTYTTSSTKWLNGTADALNKLAQKIEDKVQQIRDAQAAQTATTWLTVGLVVVDVLQLGLDPVTDAATVGVGAADVGAATAAEAAASAIVEVDAEIGTELDSIASEIEDADSLGDVGDLGDTPGDGLDGGGGDGNSYYRMDSTDDQPPADDSSDSGSSEPTDPRLQDLKTRLQQTSGVKQEAWSQMNPDQRLEALQNIDNQIAETYGFPPNQVTAVNLPADDLGGFNPATGGIEINSNLVANGDNVDALETIAHESRHAYQYYLTEQDPATLSEADRELAQKWSDNFANYIDPEDDLEGYFDQPIETDAESWATEDFMGLLDDL